MEGVKIESLPTTPLTSSEGTKSDRKGSVEDSEGALSTNRSTPVKDGVTLVKEGSPRSVGGLSLTGLYLSRVVLCKVQIFEYNWIVLIQQRLLALLKQPRVLKQNRRKSSKNRQIDRSQLGRLK